MRRGRRLHRTDTGHRELLADLERFGFTVIDLSGVGDDCPDAAIGRQGVTCLLEIKTPYGLSGEYRVSEGQRALADAWRGTPIIFGHKAESVAKEFMKICRHIRYL